MPALIITFIVLLIIVVVLKKYFNSPETIGKMGEFEVKSVIGKTIENKKYVINDLTVLNNEMTCQIDHIVINRRGIFVIETKNYTGRIYGSENQREWTQVLAYGKKKYKFYNPVKQNATHVYNVSRIVGNLPIYSLVVFVQNNTHHIEADNVIPLNKLRMVLRNGDDVLNQEQMKFAYQTLLANKVEKTVKEHIENIQEQQRNIKNCICPRCGGNLTLKKGKYGKFYGCSNYPKCKFTKKI